MAEKKSDSEFMDVDGDYYKTVVRKKGGLDKIPETYNKLKNQKFEKIMKGNKDSYNQSPGFLKHTTTGKC